MVTDSIRSFAAAIGHAFVASTDSEGTPHLAAGRDISFPEATLLVFEAWFCTTTLRNIQGNPRIAVAIADPATGKGYQFLARVERVEETALMDGYAPELEPFGLPQAQWRLAARIEQVLAFSAEAHSDRPLG
ncbi:hypothetical protein GMLC_33290 [Geomonas limicola]|uniref:Pyridoxamine 5'-phosphate oxidase N-terminal domain-containing protein n=1 Tax=Geomonas limicola TaxID=2740186 RepID=A0A6V8NBD0_9BACT|nr:pyridoxamine 5'-phosphate oxidase family protein [Geomonas limicola]GFO69750.1 hypothetical protein GMLC_33290 [Geomonas limicola]